jgi:hypothetical protein
MSKLRQRLLDPSRSGVYRTRASDAIEEAVRGSRLSFAPVSLKGVTGKEGLLRQLAETLVFPDWFGQNWDALEDCLTDFSWRHADGYILLFRDWQALPSDELGILIDVLASSAEFWAARGKPFFAVFIDADGALGLADLHREV